MHDVLHKYEFSDIADNFEREEITPDILCLLSTEDMKTLGITITLDLMKLKIEWLKFWSNKPIMDYSYGLLKSYIP